MGDTRTIWRQQLADHLQRIQALEQRVRELEGERESVTCRCGHVTFLDTISPVHGQGGSSGRNDG